MAQMQFTPISTPMMEIKATDRSSTHITFKISHESSYKRCCVIKTGDYLDSIDGQLYIYNLDESEEYKEKLSNEATGYLSYYGEIEGESGSYIVQVHISNDEFNRIIDLLTNNVKLLTVDIETPMFDKKLQYGTNPHTDPIVWNIEEDNWVFIEECEFVFEFSEKS